MSKNEYIILRSMLVTYFTHISKAVSALTLMLLLSFSNLQAQVSYSCYCDDSFPDGVLGFDITVFGNAPGETWTVDNVINLYSSVNPLIVISSGTELQPDPMNPSQYILSGYAFSGIMPFVTVRDEMGVVHDVNMMTCVIPDGEIVGDTTVCLGVDAMLQFNVSAPNVQMGSTVWNTPGASSAVTSGPDDLEIAVSYDTPGSYIVSVSSLSSTNCEITDDFIVNVYDGAQGMQISGPDYMCTANAVSVPYSVNNPEGYGLLWSTDLGTASFDPFLGNPMSGSGANVDVSFPAAGIYTLIVENADPNGCVINDVEFVVEVVDVVDTVQIIGESYVCIDNIENYTIANAAGYSNLQWSIMPAMGVIMTPADGLAENISLQFSEVGDYQLSLTGTSPDGCDFASVLDLTIPDDNIPSLACNNSVNVSLNNNCVLELLPDMILEGAIEDNDAYNIIIEDYATGEILSGNMVTQDQLGHVFKVTVIEKCGGNSCWGNLVVEDKSVTPLDQFCPTAPVVTTCYELGADPLNPLGFPNFPMDASWIYNENTDNWLVSGFDNCSDALLSYEDEVLSGDVCADPQVILRTWTAVDVNNGEQTSCDVIIHLALTDQNSIIWPNDYDSTLDADPNGGIDTDGIYPSLDPCNFEPHSNLLCGDYWYNDINGNPSPECTGAPVSNGFACPNLQLIGYSDNVIHICGSSKKILRQWTVWDACDLTDIMHTQIITVMDTVPPVCEPPAETVIGTDVHECGADIYVEPPVVTGECDDWSYSIRYMIVNPNPYGPQGIFTDANVTYDAVAERYVIHDVEFNADSLWVQYIVRDACGNKADDCYAHFELVDDEQPVPACDFNNFVTLNQFGEAWVSPSTFDDNSWDNCGVYTRVVRRMEDKCECAEPRFDFLHSLGEFNGHYYYLSKDKMHAGMAFGLASALDAYVARIDSLEENDWIRERVNAFTQDDYYIGLSGASTIALDWQEGSSLFENWASMEPQLSNVLKQNELIYTSVNEDGEWYAEGRNYQNNYYVLEIEDKCHWSQKISFCCEDVGQETMVALKVIDWHGNHNQCMVNVTVMDFLPPMIECPEDVTADCDSEFDESDLSQYGEAEAIDDCGTVTIDEDVDIDNNNCGEYIIYRRFTARDVAGNTNQCTQTVSLINEEPFDYNSVEWPADTLLVNIACSLEDIDPAITGVPSWIEADYPCSNITYTYNDLIFYIAEGVCQKLVRTWSIIDWCQPTRLWEYNQVIKMNNTLPPEFSDETCSGMTYNDAQVLGNCLVRIDDLLGELKDNGLGCHENPIWSYEVDLYNDGQVDYGSNGKNASGEYPYGTHRIIWNVIDDCHNENSCEKLITIIDNVEPTPYCHSEIVIPISDIWGVDIWASDLNLGSYDDCPNNPVYFSFEENVMVQGMTLDCSDLDSNSNVGRILVDLWVWDNINAGLANKSVCRTTIILQDNSGVCDDSSNSPVTSVSGMIYTEDLEMVHGVEMHIESASMDADMMSNDGFFAFDDLKMYDDYKVEAYKNGDYLNGVSTLDLIIIQRHILGLEKLDSPYKIIAADIDNSHSISAIDLIELRKLILGINEELSNNYSWRFVEEDYKFLDPTNPFPYSENVELDNLENTISDADFIAVKIGDVNRSASTKLQGDVIDGRSVDREYVIELKKDYTDKGNTRLQLRSTEDLVMDGLQFELNFNIDDTELMAAIPMSIALSNEHIAWDRTEEGVLRLSWNDVKGLDISAGDVLLELLFKGDKADLVMDYINSDLVPEAYQNDDGSLRIRPIQFRNIDDGSYEFEVYQNVPNPFEDETLIEFVLDRSANVQFTVSDQTGRLLYYESNKMDAGKNQIVFDSRSIEATGLLYYQISTETHTVTKKMIVIH